VVSSSEKVTNDVLPGSTLVAVCVSKRIVVACGRVVVRENISVLIAVDAGKVSVAVTLYAEGTRLVMTYVLGGGVKVIVDALRAYVVVTGGGIDVVVKYSVTNSVEFNCVVSVSVSVAV